MGLVTTASPGLNALALGHPFLVSCEGPLLLTACSSVSTSILVLGHQSVPLNL